MNFNYVEWDDEFYKIMDLANKLMKQAVAEDDVQSIAHVNRKGYTYVKKREYKDINCAFCNAKIRVFFDETKYCKRCSMMFSQIETYLKTGNFKYCYRFTSLPHFNRSKKFCSSFKMRFPKEFFYFSRKQIMTIYSSDILKEIKGYSELLEVESDGSKILPQ